MTKTEENNKQKSISTLLAAPLLCYPQHAGLQIVFKLKKKNASGDQCKLHYRAINEKHQSQKFLKMDK